MEAATLGELAKNLKHGSLLDDRTACSKNGPVQRPKFRCLGWVKGQIFGPETALKNWSINMYKWLQLSQAAPRFDQPPHPWILEQVSFTRSAWYNARKGPKTAEAMAKHIERLGEICQKMLLHCCCCFLLRRFTKVAGSTIDALGALHFVSKLPTHQTRG